MVLVCLLLRRVHAFAFAFAFATEGQDRPLVLLAFLPLSFNTKYQGRRRRKLTTPNWRTVLSMFYVHVLLLLAVFRFLCPTVQNEAGTAVVQPRRMQNIEGFCFYDD